MQLIERGRRTARTTVAATTALLVLASCSTTTSGHRTNGSATPTSTTCTLQAPDRADLFALSMTSALQKHDKAALLALFTGAKTKAAVSVWYSNINAIGFTTAGVQVLGRDNYEPETTAPKTQNLQLMVGWHNKFDEFLDKDPDTPGTAYSLTASVVHGAGGACHLSATAWKSQNNAPWDAPGKLAVVHTKHTVVAGDAAVVGDVKRVSRIAESAALYDINFFKSIHSSDDIDLHGFVMFVPKSAAENNAWFSYKSTRKPGGWAGDVGRNAAGVEYPLNGAQLPVTHPAGAPKVSNVSQIGGGRVVITRTGLKASVHDQTATLVHEFAHDIYNNYNDGWFTGKPVDAALAEGSARYLETFYRISTNPFAKNSRSMSRLVPVLRQHFSSFTGQVPTAAQIYGNASTADYYYDLSATCFSYLASKYGIEFAFQSIRNAFANGGGPFSGIVTSNKGGNITFGNEDDYVPGWASWLRTQVH